MTPRAFVRVAACAVAMGCGSSANAQVTPAPVVAAADVARYAAPGLGSIAGRLVATLPGDVARTFHGWTVYLAPVVPYTHFFAYRTRLAWGADAIPPPTPDPAWLAMIRKTTTSATGDFRFAGLPPGTYFAYAVLEVKDGRAETLYEDNYERTGTTFVSGFFFSWIEPEYGYVSRPYRHDYTCDTQGVTGGTAEVANGRTSSIDLGIFGSRNDGC